MGRARALVSASDKPKREREVCDGVRIHSPFVVVKSANVVLSTHTFPFGPHISTHHRKSVTSVKVKNIIFCHIFWGDG